MALLYKTGETPRIGDRIRGHNQSAGKIVEGILGQITVDAASCNGQIIFLRAVPTDMTAQAILVVRQDTGWANLHDLELIEASPLPLATPSRGSTP